MVYPTFAKQSRGAPIQPDRVSFVKPLAAPVSRLSIPCSDRKSPCYGKKIPLFRPKNSLTRSRLCFGNLRK